MLLGRAQELGAAEALLRRAKDTGLGSLFLVGGEPGIGKTAFLRQVHRQGRAFGFNVGFGQADQVGEIAAGAPVLLALRSGSTPLLTDTEFKTLAGLVEQPLWLVEAIADLLEHNSQRAPLLLVLDDLQWADRLSRFALRVLAGRLKSSRGGDPGREPWPAQRGLHRLRVGADLRRRGDRGGRAATAVRR